MKGGGGRGCGVKLQADALREDIFLFIGKDTWNTCHFVHSPELFF